MLTEEQHYAAMEADYRRSVERQGKSAPHNWGHKVSETHYFCLPCWQSGDETGEHPYDTPPCDPQPNRNDDFYPRGTNW